VIADSGELLIQTPRFVRDTSQLWHRPNISRDEGIFASVLHFLAYADTIDFVFFISDHICTFVATDE